MADNKKPPQDARQFPEVGEDLSRNEIMEVLADDGYSAGGRKEWLKTVLTRLSKAQVDNPNKKRAELVSEVKDILDENVSGDPEADDTL